MTKVLILGASGMLGNSVLDQFSTFNGHVLATSRPGSAPAHHQHIKNIEFDAATQSIDSILPLIKQVDYVVNCIGIIKPYINDSNQEQRLNAIRINSEFPYELSTFASKNKFKVIQIATDCVYSGLKGEYIESDLHDALDVYGKTKSLGEVPSEAMMHLRVSIIGTEIGRSTSLLEWVRNQPKNSQIFGFTDHLWNGITTAHFGKLARGIVETGKFQPGVFHVVPGDVVTKESLVRNIAKVFGRDDISIEPKVSGNSINRTLSTEKPKENLEFWNSAGYETPPSIQQMLEEIRP